MAEVDFSPEQCTAFPMPERTTLQLYYTYFLNKHSAQWCIPEDIVKLVVSPTTRSVLEMKSLLNQEEEFTRLR
jgi:hypothetical protein